MSGESGASSCVETCTLDNSENSVTSSGAPLTLSEDNLTATVKCVGENIIFTPTELTEVCDTQATDAKGGSDSQACRIGNQQAGKRVTLQDVLGASHQISWKEKGMSEGNHTPKERILELAETDLPRTDKQFFIACHKTGSATSSCKVTVNVNARPSSADDKNVVTCAYGKDSNPKPVKVEMSQNKNTLTIDCGSGGSLQPAEFTSQYCSPDTDNLEECATASYSGILPTFAPSWWTNTEKGTPAVLTIPKTDFPSTDQRFLLGCAPTSTAPETPDEASRQPEADSTTSACRVLVTVKAASSASAASFTAQVVAATSGAALLAGLSSGSL